MNPKAARINVPKELLPGGEDGADARSTQGQPGGPVQINEGVSPQEASGAPRADLSSGPKIRENGSYAPARYELHPGVICEDR